MGRDIDAHSETVEAADESAEHRRGSDDGVGVAIAAPLGELWRMLPGDVIGRFIIRACDVRTTGRNVPLPAGGSARIFEDPRLALYLDNVPLRPQAQTLGRYVIARERLPDAIVRHELVHVRHWTRLGPLFLPFYGLASVVAILAGLDRYRDNVFERAAREAETEG